MRFVNGFEILACHAVCNMLRCSVRCRRVGVLMEVGGSTHPMKIFELVSFSRARIAKVATFVLSVFAIVLNAMLAPHLFAQYTVGSPVLLGGSNDSGTFDISISGTSTVTKSGTCVFT